MTTAGEELHCTRCGRSAAAADRFCAGCGHALSSSCRSCGAALASDARFCGQCGTRAADDEAPGAAPDQAAGELRTASVLFADMSGSVAAAAGKDPEAVTDFVESVLAEMVDAVVAVGGTVDRFLGDGLLALFGSTEAHEDDPVRAVTAAFELCQRVEALGAAATAGVTTGAVYVGRVGSQQHTETTAMGQVVNLAARLQGQAKPGEVLVDAETARAAAGAFELSPRRLLVKGLPDAVAAFSITGERQRRERRSTSPVRAPVTGRERELAILRAAAADLSEDRGGVALVVGEPGLGKSRLIAEVLASLPADCVVVRGHCVESGASAYEPFRDALQAHLGWERSPAPEEQHRRLGAFLGSEADTFAVAALGDVLGLPERDAPEAWQSLPPLQRQRETFRAITHGFRHLASTQPAVVVIEDLHWADDLSVSLTAELFSVTREAPLLLFCAYRPWRDHPCWQLSAEVDARGVQASRVILQELGDESCAAVAAALLGVDAIPADLRPLIVDRAQGNPLYVEEFVRSAIEAGWLAADERGGWRLAPSAAPRVPATLELLVRARLDRLSAETRRVLQLAAVQGRTFSPQVLDEIAGVAAVQQALAELERLDIVHPERSANRGDWTFKHVLVQETVEQGILRRTKVDLHRLVLDALEVVEGGRLEERAAQLAHHAEQGGDAPRAYRYVTLAAQAAKRAFLNAPAAALFSRALSWAEAASAPGDEIALLHEEHGDVLTLSGNHRGAYDAFQLGIACSGDPVVRARLWRKAGAAYVVSREYEEALRCFAEGEVAVEPARDHPAGRHEWIDLQLARALLHYWRNEPGEIASALDRVRAHLAEEGTPLQRADALQMETMQLLRQQRYRDLEAALPLAEASAKEAEQLADPAQRSFKTFNLAFCQLWNGDLDAALATLQTAAALAERAGDLVVLSRCHTYRAVAHRLKLDEARCREATQAAAEIAVAAGMNEYFGAAEGNLAWLARRERSTDDVFAHAGRAIAAWSSTQLVYGFQWIARFPLLASAYEAEDRVTADEQAEFLLRGEQQRLPAVLEGHLVERDIPAAIREAQRLGYA